MVKVTLGLWLRFKAGLLIPWACHVVWDKLDVFTEWVLKNKKSYERFNHDEGFLEWLGY